MKASTQSDDSPPPSLQTMLGESSIVASAMVFMAEDIQKQLSGQGLTLPLDVINNVVANEVWHCSGL